MPAKFTVAKHTVRRRRTRRMGFRRRGFGKSKSNATTNYSNKIVRATTLRCFPNRIMVKLPYYSGNIGTVTTTSIGQHRFNLNDVFDPNATGVGHQPRGRDQWAAFYTRYRVMGCSIKARYATSTANATAIVGYVVQPSASSGITDLRDAIESQRTWSRQIQNSANVVTITKYFKPWVVEGVSRSQWMSSDIYAGSAGGNPGSVPHIDFFWQNADENSSTNVSLCMEVVYYVLWDVPINLTGS